MKRCAKCKCVKERNKFSSDKSRADFLNNKCKACDKRTKDSRYHIDQAMSITHYEHLKVRAAEMEMSISEYMYALIERDIQNRGPGTSEKRSQAAHTRWEKNVRD